MQLLVCLRILIRRCMYENIAKDDIQRLFPKEVLPELQKLLTLLLQKFQQEWREDVIKEKVLLSLFWIRIYIVFLAVYYSNLWKENIYA